MAIARKHGLSSGQMSTWRRQFARAAAQTPVLTRAEAVCAQSPETASRISGLIEILLPNGVVVRTDGGVSEKFLRRVLAAARG
jgi:transposase-like protein